MRVFVTGASGWIGSAVVDAIVAPWDAAAIAARVSGHRCR